MIFHNKEAEKLYFIAPDVLYAAPDGTWYAMYHEKNSILTSANNKIRVFTYRTKTDYREVKDLIISKYKLKPVKIKNSQP